MTKLWICVALVSLVAAAFAEDTGAETSEPRPVIYEALKGKRIIGFIDLTCAFRDMLMDRETSDHIYNLYDGVTKIIKEGAECAKERVIPAVNNKETILGQIVAALRMNKADEIQSLSELHQELNFGSVFGMVGLVKSLDLGQLRNEVRELTMKIVDECGGQKFTAYQEDIDFITEKFKSLKPDIQM